MDSKQRAKLKSQAINLNTIIQVGKNGITDETIKVVNNAFNTKELIKIRTIEACACASKDVAVIIAEKTKSEVVQVIGSKIILYKKMPVKKVKKTIFKNKEFLNAKNKSTNIKGNSNIKNKCKIK